MKSEDIEKIKEAGEIAKAVMSYAREIVKPGVKLLEIAENIDSKIIELGGRAAFPVNLSINEVAAHSTPAWNDESVASGLLKVDVGVHVDGFVADTAFSVDLENNEENKRLIHAAETALDHALKTAKVGVKLRDVGLAISRAINSEGFTPVINLSGHEIEQYDLHAGLSIPNYDNQSEVKLEEGLYAIEPFATNGVGKVRDGKLSGIYQIRADGNVRDNFARDVLDYILEEYSTLPFCSRWIYKKFGARGLLALRQIEQAGILHQYAQLVETSGGKVAQAEHTVILTENGSIITTLE